MKRNKIFLPIILLLAVTGQGLPLTGAGNIPDSGLAPGNSPALSLTGTITLEDALGAALASEPDLAAYVIELERHSSLEEQARKWPNPSLEMEMEEFGGNGAHQGTQVMETRIGIGQEFELGGKRGKRAEVARLRTAVARSELEAKRREVETLVKSRFVKVYTFQKALDIRRENLNLVRNSYSIISELVQAGEVSPLLEDRAAVEVATAENSLLRAEQALRKSRLELASTWNSFNPGFTSVTGDFAEIPEIPPMESWLGYLADHPLTKRWESEKLYSRAELSLAKSDLWPDIELGGGYQTFRESNEHSYYVELKVPLPLFNRNQGGIKAARAGTRIAERRQQYALLQLKNQAANIWLDISAVRAELTSLRQTLVPAARKAFSAVAEAFRLGEEEYISVIDAQRQLLESTDRQAQLSSRFFELKAELEGLAGIPLESIH